MLRLHRSSYHNILALLLALSVGVLACSAQQPQAGDLDLTFGNAGTLEYNLPGHAVVILGADKQPDGKIVLVGRATSPSLGSQTLVMRLNPDGNLDSTFATEGVFLLTYPTPPGEPESAQAQNHDGRCIKVRPDGKLAVAGIRQSKLFHLVLTADGQMDCVAEAISFSSNPLLDVVVMALRPDGSSLVGCNSLLNGTIDTDVYIYSFQNDGYPDTTFSGGGAVIRSDSNDYIGAMVVQPDGKIVVGGSTDGRFSVFVTRLNPDGTVDSTFGLSSQAGPFKYIQNFSAVGSKEVRSLVLDRDEILVFQHIHGSDTQVRISRLTDRGRLDTTFGSGGHYSAPFGDVMSNAVAMTMTPDCRILIAGRSALNPSLTRPQLLRLKWDSLPDPTFGTDGFLQVPTDLQSYTPVSLIATEDKIFVIGTSLPISANTRHGVCITKLHAGPKEDTPKIVITEQPQSQSVPIGDTLSLRINTTGPHIVRRVWFRNGVEITRHNILSGELYIYSLIDVGQNSEGTYQIETRYANQVVRSEAVMVRVINTPVIDQVPAVVTGLIGGDIDLQVRVRGRHPISTRWKKAGQVLATGNYSSPTTHTSYPSYWIYNLQEAQTGEYELEVTNDDGVATSTPIRVRGVPDPSVEFLSSTRLAVAGRPLTLEPVFHSSVSFEAQWFKDSASLTGVTSPQLALNSLTLSDAGLYAVKMTSAKGSVVSEDVALSVVDTRAREHVVASGRRYTLSLPVTDVGGVEYAWYRNGERLEESAAVSGTSTASLQFAAVGAQQAGAYVCVITLGEDEVTTEAQSLLLATQPPVLGEYTLPAGEVGSAYLVPLVTPALASRLEVKGLPAGLIYSAEGECIQGTPKKSGSYKLTVTAINSAGRSAALKTSLVIHPFPADRPGSYYGVYDQNSKAGTFEMTVSSSGSFSGKFMLCTKAGKTGTAAFKGVFSRPLEGMLNEVHFAEVPLNLAVLAPFEETPILHLSLQEGLVHAEVSFSRQLAGGTLHELFSLDAPLCPWTARNALSVEYRGVYHLGWQSAPNQGYGFGRATVTVAGRVFMAAKLADNTAVTQAGPVTADYAYNGFAPLYASRGSFRSELVLQTGDTAPQNMNSHFHGRVYWDKLDARAPGVKLWPTTFSHGMDIAGGCRYLRPKVPELSGDLMMNAQDAAENVRIGLLDELLSGTLKRNHSIGPVLVNAPTVLKSIKSVAFNATTGLFKGSGTLNTKVEKFDRTQNTMVLVDKQMPMSFQGLVLRNPGSLRGYAAGYVLRAVKNEAGSFQTSDSVLITPN